MPLREELSPVTGGGGGWKLETGTCVLASLRFLTLHSKLIRYH